MFVDDFVEGRLHGLKHFEAEGTVAELRSNVRHNHLRQSGNVFHNNNLKRQSDNTRCKRRSTSEQRNQPRRNKRMRGAEAKQTKTARQELESAATAHLSTPQPSVKARHSKGMPPSGRDTHPSRKAEDPKKRMRHPQKEGKKRDEGEPPSRERDRSGPPVNLLQESQTSETRP